MRQQSLEGQRPLSIRAVDMTLRLDNAFALPTCPQPRQQKQPRCETDPREIQRPSSTDLPV